MPFPLPTKVLAVILDAVRYILSSSFKKTAFSEGYVQNMLELPVKTNLSLSLDED